jgi:tRNA-2-methylthio-N6-dimethylallyladenosine synthase
MRRAYTVEQYRDLIGRLREKMPGIALSNDVIVGFPGETEAQFEGTAALLRDLRFDAVHIAAYSPRPGTTAARELKDDVPPAEKKRRVQALETLQEAIAAGINSRLLGQPVEVLVEGKQKGKQKGKWYGRTKTDKIVFFESPQDWRGKRAIVVVSVTGPWSMQGELRQ